MFTRVGRIQSIAGLLGVSLAVGLLWIGGISTAKAASTTQPVAAAHFAGDPYLLETDPVTGEPLGDKPIISQYEGRELRFANQKNLDAFNAIPAKYLPKVDQQMIAQQTPFYPLNTCMVSGDKLGGDMGKPVDFIYKNRLIRFCCNDCVKDFKQNPDKFVAKLDTAVIAKQGPTYPMTTCPVSGDKLGGDMGPTLDRVYGNRLVRFCCKDCLKSFNENPAKYFKMIDEAAKKQPQKTTPAPAAPATSAAADDHAGHAH